MSAARVVPVCRYYRHILCEYVDDTMYTTVIMNLPCQTILLTHLNLSIYVLGGSHAPWMVHWRFENKTGNRRGHAIHPRVTIYCSACCEAELNHHMVVFTHQIRHQASKGTAHETDVQYHCKTFLLQY